MDRTVGIEPTSGALGERRLSSSVRMAVNRGHDPQRVNAVQVSNLSPILSG
jgi:hypothetical protein